MTNHDEAKTAIKRLLLRYSELPNPGSEAERRVEEFLRPLFESLGWDWLSKDVIPQKKIRGGQRTTRVDFAFKKAGDVRPSFYLEVKRFSNQLDNPEDIQQAIGYGKNGGIRWVILTNFNRWGIFNSDFFDEPHHAELFEFTLDECLEKSEKLQWLLLFSREKSGFAPDNYAKEHKRWKKSESVEYLLTKQLIDFREKLSKAIYEQNTLLFNTTEPNEDVSLDACIQHIIDRIIFCRMLEDSGADPERKMADEFEKWKSDRRVQFYREFLCAFWAKMKKRYDSKIFNSHRIDGLSIKNEDFVPLFESFYVNPKTRLRYRFEAIGTDVLGHAYENYLSYRVKRTAKRAGMEEELYKRKQGGIYYTPEFLVDHLVRSTLGEKLKGCGTPEEALKIRVLDPACGSGTFLVRALEEFREWFEGREKENGSSETDSMPFLHSVVESCIYGIDIDPRAVQLAELNIFLRIADASRQLPKPNIIERNSLVWDGDIKNSFRFERDFPLAHEQGGFDVVITNPPWEKWKPDSQEFFEQFHEGFKSLQVQKAKKAMAEMLKSRTAVRHQWEAKLSEYRMYSDIFRSTYQFQSAEAGGRKVSGDIDLYKLFTERAYHLLKDGGIAGLVVPSGVYTDLGAKGLRSMLFDRCELKSLYSFENRGHAIFPDVHASFKPTLLVFKKGRKTESFPSGFFLYAESDLQRATENPTIIDVNFVRRSSPTSWSILEIKSPMDNEIIRKLLTYPPLGQKIAGTWSITISRGFDMTEKSRLFKQGTLFGVPMLEGKNIHHFTHKWKEAPTPRYKILEKDIEANLKSDKIYHKNYWMAYRLIGRSTDNRTFISTIVPPGYVCGHSIAIVRLPDLIHLCFLVGVMNSFVADYFIRQKVSANITMFNFLETPVPRLSSGPEFEAVVQKVAQLVCVTDEFSELKKETGIKYGLNGEMDRELARAQLDCMVAKIYGVTKDELRYILEKFPLVEQRQKDAVLSQY